MLQILLSTHRGLRWSPKCGWKLWRCRPHLTNAAWREGSAESPPEVEVGPVLRRISPIWVMSRRHRLILSLETVLTGCNEGSSRGALGGALGDHRQPRPSDYHRLAHGPHRGL